MVADIKKAEGEFAAQVLRAFMECSGEVQSVVREMLDIYTSTDADEDEREAASLTLFEALFPEGTCDPGIDLEAVNKSRILEQMHAQEETFAQRLQSLMEKKGITQEALAARAGVGQPAISMMLARKSRPQRRTISKLAEALKVPPSELWPAK